MSFFGIGAYPTNEDGTPNQCYDANRPYYWPYWFDTYAEEACRHATGDWFGIKIPGAGGPASITPSGSVDIEGNKSQLDSTLRGVAQFAIVAGAAYLLLRVYMKGR